jgi:hypothetical protein
MQIVKSLKGRRREGNAVRILFASRLPTINTRISSKKSGKPSKRVIIRWKGSTLITIIITV